LTIQQTRGFLRIYVAGKMMWQKDEDSTWTCVLSPDLRADLRIKLPASIRLVYPDDTGFDHGGDLVTGIVAGDITLLRSCDAVVAIFSEPAQTGTIIELLDAIYEGKECLLIFTGQAIDLCIEGACGILEGVSMRGASDHYWFLINYLCGDGADQVKHRKFANVTCFKSRPQDISDIIATWVFKLLKVLSAVPSEDMSGQGS
jgi:hypothetical protein